MAKTPDPFNLRPGRRVGSSYEVERLIGAGTEGEVYQIRDRASGIPRAAKFFYADVKTARAQAGRRARKLELLRRCPIVLQYLHREEITIRRQLVVALISDFCPGQPLQAWIEQHPSGRVHPFIALLILHRLVVGLEQVHALGQYHSDVHTENVLIEPSGVDFKLQLIDFYEWGKPTRYKRSQDILQCVHILADMLGGRPRYRDFPPEVKTICAGLRSDRILKRFPTLTALRQHLETFTPQTVA